MFLQSVNAGHHWQWKYCFASRGEQIIGGYPENNYIFSVSLEFSLVAVVVGGGGGSESPDPPPGSATGDRAKERALPLPPNLNSLSDFAQLSTI